MISLNTPWVLGCCGPMFRVSSFGFEPASRTSIATPSDTTEALLAAGRAVLPFGAIFEVPHQDVLVVERPVLAERVAGEALFEQDPAQVRMPEEFNPEQIVDLPLLEVRARPDGGQARAERVRLRRQVRPDDHTARRLDVIPAVAVVEHLQAVSPIDGRDRREVVVAERLHLPRHWDQLGAGDF